MNSGNTRLSLAPIFVALIVIAAFFKTGLAKAHEDTKSYQPICSSLCQNWDSFNNRCSYRSSCTIDGNVATYKQCRQWDNFNKRCGDETVSRKYLNFNPNEGSPVCTESCQYKDGFGDCIYKTTCTVMSHCASIKYCERWDNFNKLCSSERVDFGCNVTP